MQAPWLGKLEMVRRGDAPLAIRAKDSWTELLGNPEILDHHAHSRHGHTRRPMHQTAQQVGLARERWSRIS